MEKISPLSQLIEVPQESEEKTFLDVSRDTTDVETVEITLTGYYDEEIGLWEEQMYK